jgi:hypothetical protein
MFKNEKGNQINANPMNRNYYWENIAKKSWQKREK